MPWPLDIGPNCKIEIGLDEDGDGYFESRATEQVRQLAHRGLGFAAERPPRQAIRVWIRRRSGEPIRSLAPDPAVTPADIRFAPDYRRLDVAVHNTGAKPARSFEVALYAGGRLVGPQLVPHVDVPHSLLSASPRVGFPFVPLAPSARFRAVADSGSGIAEISERKSAAEADLDTSLAGKQRHAQP